MVILMPPEITKILHTLLDNVYIQDSDCVFHQCIGIPMGTNCASLVTDLLHDHESSAMILFSCGDMSPIPRSFSLMGRCIDDLVTTNKSQFDMAIGKVCPSALILGDAGLSEHEVAYLDRRLEIKGGGLLVSLNDKQDNFPFKVLDYPHLDGNVPCRPV